MDRNGQSVRPIDRTRWQSILGISQNKSIELTLTECGQGWPGEVETPIVRYKPEDGFPYYFDLTKGEDLRTLFSRRFVLTRLESWSEAKAAYRYAPGKWSIKQVVGHITDHERIKMARAFFMSRNESVELWGYDQDSLVENSRFDELTLKQLAADLENVRRASISFIDTLSEPQLKIKGRARQYEITLEDFLKSIIGHEIHHFNILNERYI